MHVIETSTFPNLSPGYHCKAHLPLPFLKAAAERPTTHYIWRTRGDGKVRSVHSVNNGKIFAWNDPPETGHPGEAYGCRCVAEPYRGLIPAEWLQSVRNFLLDRIAGNYVWRDYEMSLYFFIGNGEPVTLDTIGHLGKIREFYTQTYFWRFEKQLQSLAAGAANGFFTDNFDATYDFGDALYSYRDAQVKGRFTGEIRQNTDGDRMIKGKISFLFYDQFKDPISDK